MPRAVSLFSGCGGFCEGIELAGFEILCAVEKDKFAAETYRFNFPHIPLYDQDIHTFLTPISEIHQQEYHLDRVDLVFGGPPCQGYSQIGTRSLEDERNRLYLQFIRILKNLTPSIFLMENVPNLLLLRKGYYRDLILRDFRESGYSNTSVIQITASDYGVPQDRRRVFFLGVHDRHNFTRNIQEFAYDILNQLKSHKRVTVWDAIGDLPEEIVHSGEVTPYPADHFSHYQRVMRLDYSEPPYNLETKMMRGIRNFNTINLHNHHTKEILQRRKTIISHLEPGKLANSLPKDIWNGKRPEKWRRLHPDQPAYTLLANMHRDMSEYVHPKLQRWITVREAARIQSFHDGFIFVGSEWQQLKQIGNAVPPLAGRAVGLVAAKLLAQITLDESP